MENSLIVLPVFNEEEFLIEFYRELRESYQEEVVFIDDGSTDSSPDILQSLREEKTYILRHPQRKGYGASLITGFRFALEEGFRKIITIDVDLQHNPIHIPNFLKGLEEFQVVLGSRYLEAKEYAGVPRERFLINRYISNLIRVLFGIEVTDPFCGFRGYRDIFLKKLFLEETSYGISLEIILDLIKHSTEYLEIPIEISYPNPGRKFLDGLDDPRTRLLYYLEIISRKRREMEGEEKVFSGKPSSG